MPSVDPPVGPDPALRFADLDHVPIGLAVLDPRLTVLFWNSRMEEWTNLDRRTVLGLTMPEIDREWALPHYAGRLAPLFQGGPPVLFSPLLHPRIVPRSSGPERYYHVKASAVPDGQGGWWAFLSVEDVTVLSRRVEELRLLRTQQERMMREIHHRVKNNLNMIAGLVSLQRTRPSSVPGNLSLEDLQSRIVALAEIHDILYRSPDVAVGNTSEYLAVLADLLDRNLAITRTHRLVLALDRTIVLKTDTTVLLGLVQAELMTNALKYGLGRGTDEVLSIELSAHGPKEVVYELSHSGDSLSPDFDPTTSPGLGMVLLAAYATQLGSSLGWARGNPTRFWLKVPR